MKKIPTKKTQKMGIKKFHYIQDWGTYKNQTPVFVGYSAKEVDDFIKKQDWMPEAKEIWNYEQYKDVLGKNIDFVISGNGYTMLFIQKWDDSEERLFTIMHESFHLVTYVLGIQRLFINHTQGSVEEEGMAYQLEYLVSEIKYNLDKAFGYIS